MGDRSSIEWTDATWNPITGCSHVSPGCDHCYAETLSQRFGWTTKPWGAQHAADNVRLHPERLSQPLRWRLPRRIFVNSMSDLFHERVPDRFIDQVFAVAASAPQHVFQALTKRPERAYRWFVQTASGAQREDYVWGARWRTTPNPLRPSCANWPLPNVWLGVSVEDQRRADERIPLLLRTPAAVRWISAEPLLGPLHLGAWLCGKPSLDWVVVGGESGPGARPMDVQWARDIVHQCRVAAVPVFVKQMGRRPVANGAVAFALRDRKGADPNEWPADLQLRQYPEVGR